MKTPAAQAAAMIRKELKKHGIQAKVRSENYSMGSSINIDVVDQLPATVEEIKKYVAQFQYGHFDGMNDIYEHSNSRDDIPQAKHVFVNASFSSELRQAAWDFAKGYDSRMKDAPESPNAVTTYDQDRILSDVLFGRIGDFWRSQKPRVAA